MIKSAYAPHNLTEQTLKPLKDTVIVHNMEFAERISQGGLILPSDNGKSTGIRPRWGRVYAVGPEQKQVSVGQWVLVAHGRWTRGMDVEDADGKQTIRKIDTKDILMISDDRPQDTTFSDAIHVEAKPTYMQHN
jgi:co-chaperonin GroES (HSP10)